MRTLHCGLRVTDLERSIAFYMAVGYEVIGSVPETGLGHSTMLKLPRDDFVTVELVHDPTAGPVELGTGLSHRRPGGVHGCRRRAARRRGHRRRRPRFPRRHE
jgi:catechol 2,3-dioxygenase-like lactoylglutathione lyase family enzyme